MSFRTILRTAVCCSLLFATASFTPVAKMFSVDVEQNGKLVPIHDGVCRLKKAPFTLVFRFSEPMGVLVNASFTDSSYNAMKNGLLLDLVPGFRETGMAEELHNKDKELFISDHAPNYWYYDNKDEHRFNTVTKNKTDLFARREIGQVNEPGVKRTKVQGLSSPLYLTFASYDWNSETYERREIQRAWLKLEWE